MTLPQSTLGQRRFAASTAIDPMQYVLIAYGLMSVVSMVLYAIDKQRATRGRWRVRESTLHTVDMLGGWFGGILARWVFRHKNRKTRFLLTAWAIVTLHVLTWAVVLTRAWR